VQIQFRFQEFFSSDEINCIYSHLSQFSSMYHPSVLQLTNFSSTSSHVPYILSPKPFLSPASHLSFLSTLESDEKIKATPLTQDQQMTFLYGLASGLNDLLAFRFLRFNLSPLKILYDEEFRPFLIDYCFFDPKFNPQFDAPETENLPGDQITNQAHLVYSFGCILRYFSKSISQTPSANVPFQKFRIQNKKLLKIRQFSIWIYSKILQRNVVLLVQKHDRNSMIF